MLIGVILIRELFSRSIIALRKNKSEKRRDRAFSKRKTRKGTDPKEIEKNEYKQEQVAWSRRKGC
jgi:hypothetical protein